MLYVFQQSLMLAIAIAIVALGGMFSERSGVVNIALEGIMAFGAFVGLIFINLMQAADTTINPQILLLMAMVLAAISGGILSLMLSYAAINIKADQTIGGTAINILSPGLIVMFSVMLISTDQITVSNQFFIKGDWFLADIPVLGPLLFTKTYSTVYVGLIIWGIVTFVLYKTKFGLRLRACGEHPQAADSLGINVYKMRYAGVTLSGVLGGLGGFMFIVANLGKYSGNVAGYGFLALAVLIFAQWKPLLILPAAFFFAFMKLVGSYNSAFPFLAALDIPNKVYKMLPYLATLIVLAFTSKKSRAPKASGIPYDQGKR